MRVWISGPRVMGMRTGLSFGSEDARRLRRSAAPIASASPRTSHVYVIEGDHGLVKVGISSNPTARLARLQTSSPYKLRLVFVAACDQAAVVEAAAHDLLGSERLQGEWFDCKPELAVAAVAGAAAKTGVSLSSTPGARRRPAWHAVARFASYCAIGVVSAAFVGFVILLIRAVHGAS